MATVGLERVALRGGDGTRLENVSLTIDDGAFVGVIGGSGSGKTTLLRLVAGLDRPSAGLVRIDGVDVTRVPPGERDVSMVFQSPALFGHLSVRRNVAFPLSMRRNDAADTELRVEAETRALHIHDLLGRRPSELSAGEQQMVQIARALVRVPKVLLLDEPFAPLDEHRRHRMRAEIGLLQEGYGVTTIMATTDPLDAITLPSWLAVLDDGRLVQFAPTEEVRRSPATVLAAAATGSISLLSMRVVADTQGFWLTGLDPVAAGMVRIRSWSPALADHVGRQVSVGVRPEHVVVGATGSVPAVVERPCSIPRGGIQCTLAGQRIVATSEPGSALEAGDLVQVRIDHHVVFDPSTDRAITPGV